MFSFVVVQRKSSTKLTQFQNLWTTVDF